MPHGGGEWLACLTASGEPQDRGSGLFGGLPPGAIVPVRGVALCGIEQLGEMAFAPQCDAALAEPPDDPDCRFRVVFLGECADIPAASASDRRLAVVVPAPPTDEASALAAEYARSSAEGRRALHPRLLEAQRQTYRAGTIHAAAGLQLDPGEVLTGEDAEAWARAIGSALVRHVYHRLPSLVPPRAFGADRILRHEDIPAIFEAFVRPESLSRARRASLGPFALGLGLCWRDSMWDLRGESSPIGDLVREWLSGGEVAATTVYDRLTSPPHGLPTALVTLRLLLLVARPQPATRIALRPDHGLVTLSGEPFPGDSIRRDNLHLLAWPADPRRAFGSIEAVAPSWEPVLAYARLLTPADGGRADEAWSRERLALVLEGLGRRVRASRGAVRDRLCAVSGLDIAPALSAAWDALDAVARAADEADFLRRAQDAVGSPADLERALLWLAWAEQYADMADALAAMHRFLQEVRIPPALIEPSATRDLLRQQLCPGGTLASPNVCRGLLGRFEAFRRDYRRLYERHHEEVNAARRGLRREVEVATPTLDALQRLNRIEELGMPSGPALYEREQDLLRRTAVCLAAEPLPDASAVACPQCGLTLADAAPTEDVRRYLSELEGAYGTRAAALGRALTHQVLAAGAGDQLRALHDALQLSHLRELQGLLTDDLVAHIRGLLRRQPAAVVAADVLGSIAQQFPAVGETEVEEAAAAFRAGLIEALTQAKSQHPGRDVRIRLAPPE